MEQNLDIVDLKDCIKTDEDIEIIPLNQRYEDPDSMINQCRSTEPIVDKTILGDLQREFGTPPSSQLSKVVRAIEKSNPFILVPVHKHNDRTKQLFLDSGLNELQIRRIKNISQNILRRSLYGVLFLQDGKFFAKKPNGAPWDSVVYATKRRIEYRNNDDDDWQLFDMDQHIDDNERSHYLECLVRYLFPAGLVQYTGLFIIRLKPNIQIRIAKTYSNFMCGDWLPINVQYNQPNFYRLYPFIQYLQQHPDFA
ncbi:unnamed protein product [Rotaria socialis]|uniref:Uncharacterized protein n=2 Tax=Rotaria socialis TaxID=392032 RepID=A0A818Z4R2_9BILA|nr:unnamed protein product [Rotaria socialis]